MNPRIARYLTVLFGHLTQRFAQAAGLRYSFQLGRVQPMVGGVLQRAKPASPPVVGVHTWQPRPNGTLADCTEYRGAPEQAIAALLAPDHQQSRRVR